ncbi:MAG: hypothetical protein VW935_19280, partial [Novosphingobium sp.]
MSGMDVKALMLRWGFAGVLLQTVAASSAVHASGTDGADGSDWDRADAAHWMADRPDTVAPAAASSALRAPIPPSRFYGHAAPAPRVSRYVRPDVASGWHVFPLQSDALA